MTRRERFGLELMKAGLQILRAEAQQRRGAMIEELQAARMAGDLATYGRLREEWLRFPRIFGAGEPPI
jgi:hypothetical protein